MVDRRPARAMRSALSGARDSFRRARGGGIRLTNDGDLEIVFLGVGAAFSETMLQSNILLVKGDAHVLIDLGSRASTALSGAGLGVTDIENLLVTHSHADHVGGVEEWCLKARYEVPLLRGGARGDCKPNLLTTAGYARVLWDHTLSGGLAHSKESAPGRPMTLSDYVNVIRGDRLDGYGRPVHELVAGRGDHSLNLKLIRTRHVSGPAFDWRTGFRSVGVLVDDRVLITGDTMFDPELIDAFGAGAAAIFHDCQRVTGGVHASYDELSTLPPSVRERIFLYHLPDGIHAEHRPEEDGFAGWARPFSEGRYVFSRSRGSGSSPDRPVRLPMAPSSAGGRLVSACGRRSDRRRDRRCARRDGSAR
jgi:ribonuclease BN (tRNA processing enzyme)